MKIGALFLILAAACHAQVTSQNSVAGPMLYGPGSPLINGQPCTSVNLGMPYLDNGPAAPIPPGRLWLCDSITGTPAWDHLLGPVVSATTAAITPPTLVGCTTGTATLPITLPTPYTNFGATAVPLGSPGTGQINVTATVTSATQVTVTLCLPLTLVYTANTVPYRVYVQ